MKKKNKLTGVERLSNVSGVPIDMLTCLPYIKMCSNREITIEDAGKLLHYDETQITVKQKKLKITINGSGLKLGYLTNNDLLVTGCIFSVEFE